MTAIPAPLTSISPFYCHIKSNVVLSNSTIQHVVGSKQMYRFRRMDVKKPVPFNLFGSVPIGSRVAVQRVEQVYTTRIDVHELNKVSTYSFGTEVGGHVRVFVKKKNVKYIVSIEVSLLELNAGSFLLRWSMYRSDSSSFISPDTEFSGPDSETIDTPFTQGSSGPFVELEFEAKNSPFYLSFTLKATSGEWTGMKIRSNNEAKFCVPIGFSRGQPAPLGLTFSEDGSMNFAFFSRSAKNVILCLFDDHSTDKPALELDLDPCVNRSGDIWHTSFEGVWKFLSYGYRLKRAATSQEDVDKLDAKHVVLDPYSKIITHATSDQRNGSSPSKHLGRLSKEPTFDWSDDVRPNLDLEKLVVYRLNVKRFTEHKSSKLFSDVAGTFVGVIEKISHFKDLGVNAVLLEPILSFDEQKGPYFPRHFFSPMNIYSPSGGSVSAITSMKEMVKQLHANGIEVFVEVVFTHTTEHGALQGIEDFYYYHASRDSDLELRNALNCNFPVVQSLILDSLRHWATEFHVDGFCFINASFLQRGFHGECLSRPPVIEAIAFDPVLSKTKIIADFWDPRDMGLKETSFPHWKKWAEMNVKFCYDVRNFLRGEGSLSDLATRLCGSGDIFSGGRGPAFSFNFIASNFGLPLVDLVSFSRGGDLASELSWNCGAEGPTKKTEVLERRLKQIRNYLFILFVSLGIPVLNMGDECGQSSGGSTSHSDRKPFDWNSLSTGFGMQITQFIAYLSSLKMRRSDLLQRRSFIRVENIDWHGSDQSPPRWDDPSCKFLALTLKTEPATAGPEGEVTLPGEGSIFMAFNASGNSENVALPPVPEDLVWHRLVDTALPFPGFFSIDGERTKGIDAYEMKSHSCTLFEARTNSG